MAFTSQSTSSIADFFSKLNTFLSGEGWSTHLNAGAGEFAAWKNPSGSTWITCATKYDTGSADSVGIYQWHGANYNTGVNPWQQTNDSGNGAASGTNANLAGNRNVSLASGGVVSQFWCFEDTNYFHVIARTGAAGSYRYAQFGAGLLTKYNDWTGGEYCYAQAVDTQSSGAGVTRLLPASYLLDGLAQSASAPSFTNMEARCATLHIEGMDNQAVGGKWGVSLGNQASGSLGTDRGGTARLHIYGGYRSGLFAPLYHNFEGTYARGLVPLGPVIPAYFNRTTNNIHGPLGVMPDVRSISLFNFEAEDSITVGSDTWVVFPAYRRFTSATGNTSTTGYLGVAYKQVT